MSARRHAVELDALVLNLPGAPPSPISLGAPGPGWFVPAVRAGELVGPGARLGELERLGRRTALLVPRGCAGAVLHLPSTDARVAVAFRDALVHLDPTASAQRHAAPADNAAAVDGAGLVVRAPSSGRFYARPGPGKPAFVQVGDVVETGHTLCLLEVMKTFHRVTYGGAGLPPRAQIEAILVAEDADVAAEQPLVRVVPA